MIISASRRTDIPSYYSEWFLSRLKAGYVLTRNPFNYSQVFKLPLDKESTDCIVFWTKDACNMLSKLDILDDMGYKYYFQFTVTPYDKMIEPNLRDKAQICNNFINISKKIGKEKVLWRYAPIILNNELDTRYHKIKFAQMCERFQGYTDTVTISFVQKSPKLKTDIIRDISDVEMIDLAMFIGETAKYYGMQAKVCCSSLDLSLYGVEKSSCISKERIVKVCGYDIDIKHDKKQREGCGCVQSVDIGSYNSCINGCVYCYANYNTPTTRRNYDFHDPTGEMMIGEVLDKEQIRIKEAVFHRIERL